MEVEIDLADVDVDVVNEVLVVLTEAMLDADVDPTVEEMVMALGEMMQALLEESMGVGGTMH